MQRANALSQQRRAGRGRRINIYSKHTHVRTLRTGGSAGRRGGILIGCGRTRDVSRQTQAVPNEQPPLTGSSKHLVCTHAPSSCLV